MKLQLKSKSILLINLFFVFVLLAAAATYWGIGALTEWQGTILYLVILGVIGLEIAIFELFKNPTMLTYNNASRYVTAVVFALLAAVLLLPIVGIQLFEADTTATILMLGAVMGVLVSFTKE